MNLLVTKQIQKLQKQLSVFLLKVNFFVVCLFLSLPLQAYERIISLKPNLTEMIFELGLGSKVVGVSQYCDYPASVLKLPKVADYIHADVEKIISLKPDLIVSSYENSSREEMNFLTSKGYTVLYLPTNNFKEIKDSFIQLGIHLGAWLQAKEKVKKFEENLALLKLKAQSKTQRRVLFVVGSRPWVVAGSQNLFQEIAPYLALENVAAASKLAYPSFSMEQIILSQPDLIFDFSLSMQEELKEEEIQKAKNEWKKFPQIKAVKENKLYFFSINRVRASLRILDEIEKILGEI